jgi:hypothetical protein
MHTQYSSLATVHARISHATPCRNSACVLHSIAGHSIAWTFNNNCCWQRASNVCCFHICQSRWRRVHSSCTCLWRVQMPQACGTPCQSMSSRTPSRRHWFPGIKIHTTSSVNGESASWNCDPAGYLLVFSRLVRGIRPWESYLPANLLSTCWWHSSDVSSISYVYIARHVI